MIFPVRANGERKHVECEFAPRFEHTVLDQWKRALDGGGSIEQRDAVEYCESALAKSIFYDRKSRVAGSESELIARTQQKPESEILGILSVTAPWWEEDQWLGFCEFRRTWSNNIVFDFLAIHPRLLAGNPRPISGVGTALLYRLALVARTIGADLVWAETTDSSVHFYSAVFELENLTDLFILKTDVFYERLHVKLR